MREAQASVAQLEILMSTIIRSNQKLMRMMSKTGEQSSRVPWSTDAPFVNDRADEESCNHVVNEVSFPIQGRSAGFVNVCNNLKDREDRCEEERPHTNRESQDHPTIDKDSIITVPRINEADSSRTVSTKPTFTFTFDDDLNNSRPYARVTGRDTLWTPTSSAMYSLGWSYLSGISLTDVSQLSVLGLPIERQDIWNGEHYTTRSATSDNSRMEVIFSRTASQIDSQTQKSSKRSSTSTPSLTSRMALLGSQVQSSKRRRSLNNRKTVQEIGTDLMLIGKGLRRSISHQINVQMGLTLLHQVFLRQSQTRSTNSLSSGIDHPLDVWDPLHPLQRTLRLP